MKIWKHSPLDASMLAASIGQLVATLWLASHWDRASLAVRVANIPVLIVMIFYNVIVISHLFTHTPWFESPFLNSAASMLNSLNIGQSVQTYRLLHVRNHHRYNNDRNGPGGTPKDLSSTFQDGENGEHASLFRYAFLSSIGTLIKIGRALSSVPRLWRVSAQERILLALASESPGRRAEELRQVRLDRMAQFFGICVFLAISWKWTLLCYLPAFYFALSLVNVQNYYEHYGAVPEDRYANSVSYYGRIYNLLTFNDGYHQEHHLRPQAHWSHMPEARREYAKQLEQVGRIISTLPAVLGFFHRGRAQLHRRVAVGSRPPRN